MEESEEADDPRRIDDETAHSVGERALSRGQFPPVEETRRLVRAFIKIRKPEIRDRVLSMVERLSNE